MDQLRPIFWGQGMFLQPQHFQQQDGYHEARLRRYLHSLYPYCWGIKSLVIHQAALQNFRLEIERCELVTWEGTIVEFQGESSASNAHLLPRSFEEAMDPGGKPLEVYLGLKHLRREEPNLAVQNAATGTIAGPDRRRRFSLQEVTTPDLFAPPGQDCALQYLMYEVQVLFGDEIGTTHDCELVKIGELERTTDGRGANLSRRYIPPCLTVHASPVLDAMLKDIRDLLTAKGREFLDYKRQRRVQTLEMGTRETGYLLIMQTLNRYIPLFHHHLEVQETHPCLLYALLRQLVGELSTFSETISVLGGPLPPYRHDRLWECFDAAVQVTKALLDELAKGPEYVVPLTFDGEYFAASLDRKFFTGNNHYYLSIRVDIPPRELERLLTGTGKVCSREEMEALRQRALPGLMVRYLDSPPEDLPRRAHCHYFEIDHHGTLWQRLEQRQNIAVFCQVPPEKTEMQLMVLFDS
jgi:type VI secretion system protein ImpJ